MRDLSLYRPNVGIVLFNTAGHVWLGQRDGSPAPHNWQFPQGGIDEGEDIEAAARRELQEETGVTSVAILGRTEDWLTYDFPPDLISSKRARGWLGQKQLWFAMRFLGSDDEINLAHHDEVEFNAWCWSPLAETLDRVVPFKRDVYRQIIDLFGSHATAS